MLQITFRIDPNKVLHTTKQAGLHVGDSNQIIQIFIHPSLVENISSNEFILHYKNKATTAFIPMFISPEQKESFYILEAITSPDFASISGTQEIWVEAKTSSGTFVTTSLKMQIKPTLEKDNYKYTSIEADALEHKLHEIEIRCKNYYQMAKREREKAQKCVQIMMGLLEENIEKEAIREHH